MARELTTSAPHVTAATSPSRTRALLHEHLPFRAVVLPWLLVRAIIVPVIVLSAPAGQRAPGRLIWMDGQWFRLIALDFYDRPYIEGLWSEYPFFPLFPSLAGALIKVGASPTLALAGISWLAALAAMAGAYRLAVRHLPPRAAPWAPWFVAVAPGAVTMILGYADSLYLAGLVWALVLVEDRRWWAAGALAAVATASRPNGWIAPAAVLVAVLVARAGWRAVVAVLAPSVAVFVGWCTYLRWATGDPFVFWEAKKAWIEITLAAFVRRPFAYENWPSLFHLVCLVVLVIPYLMRVRRQPPAWAVVVVLGVIPSLLLGTVGMARYGILAFPMPLAAADLFASRARWPAVTALIVSCAAMIFLGVMINQRSWLP